MPDLPPLTSSDAPSRARRVARWLAHTWAGRMAALAFGTKVGIQLVRPLAGELPLLNGLDAVASLGLVLGALVLLWRGLGHVRRVVLWRVRRKLLLSYFLIGVVPAFLLVVFFSVCGLLLFFNVGAYMLRSQVAAVVEQARAQAATAASTLSGVSTSGGAAEVLAQRVAATSNGASTLALTVVDGDGRCGGRPSGARAWAGVVTGPWPTGAAPAQVPSWVPCEGFGGVVDGGLVAGRSDIAVRAVAWTPDGAHAVVVEVPLDVKLVRELSANTGVSIRSVARLQDQAEGQQAASGPAGGPPRLRLDRPVQVPLDGGEAPGIGRSLRWGSFLESTDWADGRRSVVFAELGVDFAGVYRRLMAAPTPPFADVSFAQVLLILLAVVAGLFFLIQLVAYVMGVALARSITGAVHALFVGTEQVRLGDFSHKISVPSHDQLGELASSFNTMTTSIEDLLRQKAQKDRLEQELQIARGIQMSLLPQAPLCGDGVVFAGYCEPARAVGGDYFDFWAIDGDRFGMLIADVAGKGTSAALYMAELKGIVLSLSQSHSSPRQLLIDANRIISRHLDSRSFITMTYGVVDVRARSLTYARAGHCPLIRLPGPGADAEPEILAPDGLVLGLQIDDTGLFDRLLEEVTLPLATGDVFVLYTDGVTEAMNPDGEFFGEARLSALAQRYARESFAVLRQRVLEAVTAFAGPAEQQDDITMLVLQVHDLPRAA